MADRLQTKVSEADPGELRLVADLLGGQRTLGHRLDHPLDAHEMLLGGLPGSASMHLVGHLPILR